MKKIQTILYVEDDDVVRMAYEKHLQQAGFHVITAGDGLEAIKRLLTISPDLLILDLMLPKFSGEEVLRFVRTHEKLATVPVVILATNSIVDMALEPLLESACQRIIKSQCTPAILLAAVHAALPEKSSWKLA